MPYGTPANPVAGTVITVAYAVANILEPIRALRALLGQTDAPGSGYVPVSVTTLVSNWTHISSLVLTGLGYTPVNKAGDTMDGNGLISRKTHAFNGTLCREAQVVARTPDAALNPAESAAIGFDRVNASGVALVHTNDTVNWLRMISHLGVVRDFWTNANMGSGSGMDADLLDGQQGTYYATAAALAAEATARSATAVPSGLIAAFANVAAIAAGWTRYTNGNGRFLVGAGTVAGQTFVEGASAGSSWAHLHGVSLTAVAAGGGAVQGGGSSTASPSDHTHGVSGNTVDATWIPPSFTIVWAQKS